MAATKLELVQYTILEWAEIDGYEVGVNGYTRKDIEEIYSSEFGHGRGVTVFASTDEEAAVVGIEYEDGTYGIFGAGMDADGLTWEEMIEGIIDGM